MRPSSLAMCAAAAVSLLATATACSPQSSTSGASPASSAASATAAPSASASASAATASATAPSPSAPAASSHAASPADPLAGLSADKITQTAFANLKATSGVHVSGSLADSGSSIGLNLTIGKTTCSGTISESGTGSFQILQDGTTVYLKPDNTFWKSAGGSDASTLRLLEGKYLKLSTTDKDFASIVELCSPAKLAGLFGTPAGLVKGNATEISGRPALTLTDTGDSGSFDVSDSATPLLLRLDAGDGEKLDFTNYGVPATVTPPPASETLSGPQYGL